LSEFSRFLGLIFWEAAGAKTRPNNNLPAAEEQEGLMKRLKYLKIYS
jgi:hypothetical protein